MDRQHQHIMQLTHIIWSSKHTGNKEEIQLASHEDIQYKPVVVGEILI